MAGGHAIHAGPRGRPCGAPRGRGSANGGPTGIVGPGKMVGAVTRKRYTAPQFILDNLESFFRVGLCFLPVQDAWRLSGRQIQGHRVKCVDVVDTESTRSPSRARAQLED